MPSRHRVPVWLMGLTNLSYGLYGGVIAFAVPQLLGDRHVPESSIAGLTAVAFSPGFWAFLVSPVLDVRFSRRWYAVVLAVIASLSLVVAFLNLDQLGLLEVVLTAGFAAAYLYQSAIGGWLSAITSPVEEKTVSVWMTIGNVGGFGLMAIGCNQLVRYVSPLAVALLAGISILLPTIAFPFMQAPGPDRRLARESFPQFFGDLVSLVKRREVLVAVILFAAPAGTFSLTNFLGGRGNDFLLHHLGLRRADLLHALHRRLRFCPWRNRRQHGPRRDHRHARELSSGGYAGLAGSPAQAGDSLGFGCDQCPAIDAP
jgi:MFS transporter, PAT family, beta-lactamase induction signal transducer AmpG